MMKKLLFASFLLMAAGAAAQTEVSNYQPGITEDGVTYCLPKTTLKVKIIATKTVYEPGDFCMYAEKYLRLMNVPSEAQTTWTIKSVEVYPESDPDKTKMYSIKLKKKTVAPQVALSKDGILLAIHTNAPAEKPEPADPVDSVVKQLNPRDYMSEDILSAGSTAKMAELVAQDIYNIRESRNDLTRGKADTMPTDGEQLRLMLRHLDDQENALLQLFKGTSTTTTQVFTLMVKPTGELKRHVLFRFSRRLGAVANNDLAGEPVYIDITDMKTVDAPVQSDKKKKEKEGGVYYNVPGKGAIRIYTSDTDLYKGTESFSQFGNTEVLSNDLFNKDATTKVQFYRTSGGIMKINE